MAVTVSQLRSPRPARRGYRANVDLARLQGAPWRFGGSCEKETDRWGEGRARMNK